MAKIKIHKESDYTILANTIFRDTRLSYKARGLLTQMLSFPDGWEYSLAGLASIAPDGLASVRSGIHELEGLGYLKRRQAKDGKGLYSGYEYDLYEKPPSAPNPSFDFRTTEKRTQSITKELSTNERRIERIEGDKPRGSPPKGELTPRPGPVTLSEARERGIAGDLQDSIYEYAEKAAKSGLSEYQAHVDPPLCALTKRLMKAGYVRDGLEDPADFEAVIERLASQHGWKAVRNSVGYFLSRCKGEERKGVVDRLAYFRAAVEDGVRRQRG